MSTTLPIWDADSESEDVASVLQDHIKGRNVLITGCTIGGLGFEAARVIAKYANLVIIAGSSSERLDSSSKAIKQETPSANVRTLIIDLSSLESVRKAAVEVNAYSEPIHILINNAAAKIGDYLTTKEGFESQFGINHLAHFLFTLLIFPRILAARPSANSNSSPPRVVIVASAAHQVFGDGINFDDLSFGDGNNYNNYRAYGQSKTANFLFAAGLNRRVKEKGVLVFTLQPGAIWTNSAASTSKEDYIAMGAMDQDGKLTDMFNWRTMGQGGAKYIIAAFDPRIEGQSGGYVYSDGQIHNENVASYATDPDSSLKLWSISEKMVGQAFPLKD